MKLEVTLITENNVDLDNVLNTYAITEEGFLKAAQDAWELVFKNLSKNPVNDDKLEVKEVRIIERR